MPKAISYTKGSIIYFAGDVDDRIFILQKGTIIATTNDVETKLPVTEQIKNGEFFGVKSAVGHFPREETVTALQEAVCITMTIQEFEALFSTNKQIMMKMLRVFSNQLRQIHRKTESILSKGETISQMQGMFSVATAFFNDERWRTCLDVCTTFLKLYPTSEHVLEIKGMLAKADAAQQHLLTQQAQERLPRSNFSSFQPSSDSQKRMNRGKSSSPSIKTATVSTSFRAVLFSSPSARMTQIKTSTFSNRASFLAKWRFLTTHRARQRVLRLVR